MQTMTHKQMTTLAAHLNSLRPDWGRAGCEAALDKARHLAPPWVLSIAAVNYTQNASARTPEGIAHEGPHWQGSAVEPRFERPNDGERCSVCNLRESECRRKWRDDHRFLSVHHARQQRTTRQIDRSVLQPTATYEATED